MNAALLQKSGLKTLGLGVILLFLGALAVEPKWFTSIAKSVYDGFYGLFLAGWMC